MCLKPERPPSTQKCPTFPSTKTIGCLNPSQCDPATFGQPTTILASRIALAKNLLLARGWQCTSIAQSTSPSSPPSLPQAAEHAYAQRACTPLGQAESNAHFWIMSAVRSVAGFTLSSANLGPLPSTYVFQALHKASAAGGMGSAGGICAWECRK